MTRNRTLILIAFLLNPLAFHEVHAGFCSSLLVTVNQFRIQYNQFKTTRGLYSRGDNVFHGSYEVLLGQAFITHLESLGPHQSWIDVGAGAGCAAAEYFQSRTRDNAAFVTALAKTRAFDSHISPYLDSLSPQYFQFINGLYLHELDLSKLKKADVVSDAVGALAYWPDFSGTLQQELSLLKDGGILYTVDKENIRIQRPDGNAVSMHDYFHALKGAELLPTPGPREIIADPYYWRLRRTSGVLHVPPLILIKMKTTRDVPLMTFLWP